MISLMSLGEDKANQETLPPHRCSFQEQSSDITVQLPQGTYPSLKILRSKKLSTLCTLCACLPSSVLVPQSYSSNSQHDFSERHLSVKMSLKHTLMVPDSLLLSARQTSEQNITLQTQKSKMHNSISLPMSISLPSGLPLVIQSL